MRFVFMVFEAVLLALSLSLDAFLASFAYGSSKIKIPLPAVTAINLVCSGILALSLLVGNLIRPYLSPTASHIVCFAILMLIGLEKLVDNATKAFIRRHREFNRQKHFTLFNFKFILSVYADPEKADIDASKSMSFAEACSLAIALSLDGMAVGFGAALGNVNWVALVIASLFADTGAVLLGVYLGRKLTDRFSLDLSWVSGVVLILLAISKIW